MDVDGSPEYELTWKQWDMPSGPPICALRASARRTSDNGCGGWPTPVANDDNKSPEAHLAMKARMGGGRKAVTSLQVMAKMAGWLTPRADESASDRKRNGKPNLQGLARMASGTMQSGSPAPTERQGVLNPALSLWLMGYPDEWLSCGVRAMQSFQSSRRRS